MTAGGPGRQASQVRLRAPAKLNLTLEVLGRRADGYHEVRSVLQTIDLADTLTFSLAEGLHLGGHVPGLAPSDDLTLRAARLLQRETGCAAGARIHLEKRIPVAAGLGGGSSDAATTLQGLNQLWGLNLGREELAKLGAQLGSDVPFFLSEGTALVEGRGEVVTPLPSPRTTWFLIVPKEGHLGKTAQMYARLQPHHYSEGKASQRMVASLVAGSPETSTGVDLDPALLRNVFDEVAQEASPSLRELWRRFEALGARNVHLAGSGPSLFALMESEEAGDHLVAELARQGVRGLLVRSLAQPEETVA